MPKRLNTIIIVPHSKANFFKFSFSTRSFFLVSMVVVAGLILSAIAIAYTGQAVGRRAELGKLQKENQELEKVNSRLEKTIGDVQGRLDEFEERASRLALATGIQSGEGSEGSLGGHHGQVSAGGPFTRVTESPQELISQGDLIARRLGEVEEEVRVRGARLIATPTIAPVMGIITDGFGRRKDPFTGRIAFHRGLDLSARRGTPVLAPADGIVVFAERNAGMGRMVRISHGFGYTTAYGHLSKILVKPGDSVHRGDQIGLVGSTGRSTGSHLHYEVHVDGKAVNPLYYILNAY